MCSILFNMIILNEIVDVAYFNIVTCFNDVTKMFLIKEALQRMRFQCLFLYKLFVDVSSKARSP